MTSPLLVSAADLARELSDPALSVIDVRASMEIERAGSLLYPAGHIPGARFMSFEDTVCGRASPEAGNKPLPEREAFVRAAGRAGIGKGKRAVLYDDGSFCFAGRLLFTLRLLGFADARILDGGFPAWKRTGLPVSREIPPESDAVLEAGGPLERVFSTKEAEEIAEGASPFFLVDARGPATWRAGHIPGSLCRFSGDNIGEDGLMKKPEALRAEFLELLAGRDPARLVHSCGAGVRASANLLAARIAGLETAGVYVGSFSAWASDPEHEIETGG